MKKKDTGRGWRKILYTAFNARHISPQFLPLPGAERKRHLASCLPVVLCILQLLYSVMLPITLLWMS
ncbi:hypothetical protein M431DRAFT_255387 [Trichoderma harzianum CBS 226.95]|uniref:Uncharacterized protein n=1 Tax=Trichoderma harzianum CBS 226.95 TaxID=983964 RepID=A0A2T4A0C2_TRIHA|nr:hypothetical protein M431DRAFT_255387 [Trichoderma harzianum CBS 226.95]PTB50510.1 hypothetical protein M431DRAFT_255387 [Trichoderma harzianum CBS 226.95]